MERMIEEGDSYARMIYEAMALQIAKSIAGLSCTLRGQVDVIILTGGIAHSKMLTDMIAGYCGHIGKGCGLWQGRARWKLWLPGPCGC